jgi:flagellar biosynthetic protein FliR
MGVSPVLSLGTLVEFLLVLTRLGSALVFVPIPGAKNAPSVARVILIVSLTLSSFPIWPAFDRPIPTAGQLVVWVMTEAVFGIGVGLTIAFLAESLTLATQIIGLQAGYSYASTIDPNSEADSPVLGILAQLTANLLFFVAGGDRMILRAFARSLETWPLGESMFSRDAVSIVVQLGGGMLELGVRLALPVAGLLLLIDLTLALLGRINAQMQLLTLAFPLKMLAGLCVLAALIPVFPVIYGMAVNRSWAAAARLLER